MQIRTAITIFATTAALLAVTASARPRMTEQERLDKALAGRVAGAPKSCLDLRDIQDTERLGKTILYSTGRKTLYRMDTNGGCESSSFDTMVNEVYGSQLCRGDVIRTVDLQSGFHTGFCVVTNFVPYTRPKT